jgi:hypothetical protein
MSCPESHLLTKPFRASHRQVEKDPVGRMARLDTLRHRRENNATTQEESSGPWEGKSIIVPTIRVNGN